MQVDKIITTLNKTKINCPILIVGSNEFERDRLLNMLCDNYGWEIIEGSVLMNDIISSMQKNKIVNFRKDLLSRSALVIDGLDCFKGKENLQWHLEKILLRCHNPVVLTLDTYDKFTYDMRALFSDSFIIALE